MRCEKKHQTADMHCRLQILGLRLHFAGCHPSCVMSCEERCEPSGHAFRRPVLHLFGGALYAYQTSSDALPGPSRRQRHHNGRPNEGIMPS